MPTPDEILIAQQSAIPAGQPGSSWVLPTPPPGTTPPPTTPPAGPNATPGGLGITYNPDPNQAAIDKAQRDATSGYNNGPVDEAKVRADTLGGFQSEIDALNKAIAETRERISGQYRAIGQKRLGSNRALLANAGMLGQVSGEAQQTGIEDQTNKEAEDAISLATQKYQDAKTNLMGIARSSADAAVKAKQDAYSSGATATVAYLKDKQSAAEKAAADLARRALTGNIDLSDKGNSTYVADLAKQIGVTPDFLVNAFSDAKVAAAKAKLENDKIQSEIIKNGQITLNEGETLFDATGKEIAKGANKPIILNEGDVILNPDGSVKYKNPKTFAPTDAPGLTYDGGIDAGSLNGFLAGKTDAQKAAFNSISDLQKSNVMQLLNGDVLLSDLVKSRGVAGTQMAQELLAAARAVDPSFSENANKQRYAFKNEWNNTNGKAYNTRTAVNTAVGHLARLKELSDKLNGVGFKVVNGVIQKVQKNLNNEQTSAIAEFQDTISLLASEMAKAYKGGVPDQDEVNRQLNSINVANPKDVNTAVINNKVHLLNSLLESTGSEYKNTMGSYPEQLLHREVLDRLQAAGVDTKDITKVLIKQGMKASSVGDYEAAFPEAKSKVDKLVKENPSLSEQDVLQILQGDSPYFNNVGADTNQGSQTTGYPPGFVGPKFSTIELGSNLARKNNNPGNLRFVGQPGASQGTGGFAYFPSPQAGVQALARQLALDASRGHTLASFINKYAPPSENNTGTYIQQAMKNLGVAANTKLAQINPTALIKFMALKESSTRLA